MLVIFYSPGRGKFLALQRVVGSSLSVTEQFIDETGRVKLWN
ncbi:hypothetical protein [Vibrio vulnificus YJ016]|uniref:Uncharacterized protein n=1 Tax=Vibrio vulnificus (strain YJ016) TaxID=196600 RepID=Q7MQG1_VIBVY|nr:hypothetical protein [Vibrio vulnificus YJ016]